MKPDTKINRRLCLQHNGCQSRVILKTATFFVDTVIKDLIVDSTLFCREQHDEPYTEDFGAFYRKYIGALLIRQFQNFIKM